MIPWECGNTLLCPHKLCPALSHGGFSRRAKVPNLPCTLPSQHHGPGQHLRGIILPGSVPCSREVKPCHHPLSDSKICINWLIKCRANFLSRPAPVALQSRISGDRIPSAAWDGVGRKPSAHTSPGWAGGCAGLCFAGAGSEPRWLVSMIQGFSCEATVVGRHSRVFREG